MKLGSVLKKKKKHQEDQEKDSYWVSFVNDNIIEHPIIRNFHPKMALAENFYKGDQYKVIELFLGLRYVVRKMNRIRFGW